MRRPIIFTLAGLAALGSAGIALAHGNEAGNGLKLTPVAASFTAAPGEGQASRTCTGADGTYLITRGIWSGTAVSASNRLAGALAIRGELVVNQTTGAGWLSGRVRIDGNGDERSDAGGDLRAVIANGKLTGFLSGRVRDEGQLFASVSANVGRDGLTDGQIGRGAITPAALLLDRGPCEAVARQRPLVETRGTVAATTETAITVARTSGDRLTCAVGADLAAAVARLKVGDRVFVACGLVDGSYRLLKLTTAADTAEQKPVLSQKGTVSAVSATSLTVKGDDATTTCIVGADLAAATATVKVGDTVALTCAYVDGSYRLVRLTLPRSEQKPVLSQRGTVSAISATSLTVKGDATTTTCAVGSDLATAAGALVVGDTVAITCAYVDGSYRVVRIAKAAARTGATGATGPTGTTGTTGTTGAASAARSVLRMDGRVSAISATSITVTPERGDAVTCSVGGDLAASLARVSVDQQVSVSCGLVDGSYRLLAIRATR